MQAINPANSTTIIVKEPRKVAKRLKELGLSIGLIRGTALAWSRAEAVNSPFEPRNAPGLKGWISGTGFYREHLSLESWDRLDPLGVPISLNRATGISVSATSGSSITGLDCGDQQPTTKNPKGAATVEKVLKNAAQLDMWAMIGTSGAVVPRPKGKKVPSKDRVLTWLILIYFDAKNQTVRAEVSLPAAISGGRVRRWVERILVEVPARKPEPEKRGEADDDNDDDVLDVPVRRRA